MNTENKYFTPDIEDIRVGYECEEGSWDSKEDKRIWHKYIWPGDRAPDDIEYYAFQTPYLTKEQIKLLYSIIKLELKRYSILITLII